jgi:hypothetical protein
VEIITKKPCWLKSRATAGLAAQHVELMAKNQDARFETGRFRHSRLPQHVAGSLLQSGFCAASSQLDVLVTASEAGSVLQLLEGSSMRAHTKDRDYARPASGIGPPKWTGGQNRERDPDKRSSGADQVRPSA